MQFTGKCTCRLNFYGESCQYMSCPDNGLCSGKREYNECVCGSERVRVCASVCVELIWWCVVCEGRRRRGPNIWLIPTALPLPQHCCTPLLFFIPTPRLTPFSPSLTLLLTASTPYSTLLFISLTPFSHPSSQSLLSPLSPTLQVMVDVLTWRSSQWLPLIMEMQLSTLMGLIRIIETHGMEAGERRKGECRGGGENKNMVNLRFGIFLLYWRHQPLSLLSRAYLKFIKKFFFCTLFPLPPL